MALLVLIVGVVLLRGVFIVVGFSGVLLVVGLM